MEIEKSEAQLALASIDAAGARSTQLQRYRRFAPFLILWGGIWLMANSLSDLARAQSGGIWLAFTALGVAGSFCLGWRQRASSAAQGFSRQGRGQGWRWGVSFLVLVAFQVASIAVLQPIGDRAQDTYLSMFWTFLYMAIGVWTGWRLFAIGLAATLLILLGYFGIHTHYFLYMGWVSGGALIAGGLWLRRL